MQRTRRLIVTLAAAVGLAAPFAAASSAAGAAQPPPPSGDTLVQLCYHDLGSTINTPQYAVCRGLQAAADAVGAACRTPLRDLPDPAASEDCRLVDGRQVSEARIAAYQHSWVHRALTLQRALDDRVPLYEAQIPGTHNSFNASSYFVPLDGRPIDYYPTLTNQDPNQVYSITDQLRMDIRGIEVDLHWVPSLYGTAATGGYWVDVCHGQSTPVPATPADVHVGCTIDRSFQSTLDEIHAWLQANPHQFLLIYLENQLDGSQQAHDVAASLIRQHLGSLVYRPRGHLAAGTCRSMPYSTSRHHMERTGARVLLVGNCGPGSWNRWVFTRGPKWDESGDPTTYDASTCLADEAARTTHSTFRRWYEESPFLEALMSASQTLTPAATRLMVRCGVNLTGWDQLMPSDGRLRAFVWSWASGQPAADAGHCAVQGANGRFRAARCGRQHPFACVDRAMDWRVTTAAGPASAGAATCAAEYPGTSFGVPPNGLRNAQLQAAKPAAGAVWLNYSERHGRWHPGGLDPAP